MNWNLCSASLKGEKAAEPKFTKFSETVSFQTTSLAPIGSNNNIGVRKIYKHRKVMQNQSLESTGMSWGGQ